MPPLVVEILPVAAKILVGYRNRPIGVGRGDLVVEGAVHAREERDFENRAGVCLVFDRVDPAGQPVISHPPPMPLPLKFGGNIATFIVDPDVEAVELPIAPFR